MINIHPDVFKILDIWFEYKWKLNELPGIALGVVVNGKTKLAKGYGKSSPLATYRIASISKTFTAIGILQLQEKRKLKLNDLVVKYLPEFTSPKHPKQNKITIRQLLNHTGLLNRDGKAGQWETGRFPKEKSLLAAIHKGVVISGKGIKWKYSNVGYSVLGLLIERVSGLSYEEYMQKNIVKPLKMRNTSSVINKRSTKLLTIGHVPEMPGKPARKLPQYETYAMAGATGFSSNVEDLILYMQAIINRSPKLLRKKTWNIAFTTQWKSKTDQRNLFLIGTAKSKRLGHGGGFPGFATRISIDTKNKIGVVGLVNQNPAPLNSYTDGIFSVIDESPKLLKRLTKLKTKPSRPSKYEGKFENLWGHVQIITIAGQLIAFDFHNGPPTESMAILEHKGGNTFIIHDADGYGSDGELLEFLFKKGKLVGMDWAGHFHKKVK